MGRKGKNKRTKSSESDSELNSSKIFKAQDGGPQCRENVNASISEIISEANCALYPELNNSVQEDRSGTDLLVFSPVTKQLDFTKIDNTKSSPAEAKHKQVTMESKSKSPTSDSEKLDMLLLSVSEIKTSQENMKKMFESKLDRMRNELTENINSKVKSLRDEISMDISRESGRIDELMKSFQSLQGRISGIEQNTTGQDLGDNSAGMQTDNGSCNGGVARFGPKQLDDSNQSVIISGLASENDENLLEKVQAVISALGDTVKSSVSIVNTHRFRQRFGDNPGIVKVTFASVEHKILVLRNKMKLKDNTKYSRVYIKSSKSRAERLMESNTRAILKNLPNGHNLRLGANGRITANRSSDSGRQ